MTATGDPDCTPEDELPHEVEGVAHVPICSFCLTPISLVGPDYTRWEHDIKRLNVEASRA